MFFRIDRQGRLARGALGRFCASTVAAKRKGTQVIENKELKELRRFRTPMISMAYDGAAKTASFRQAKRVLSLFAGFSALSGRKRKDPRNQRRLGARPAGVARLSDSEMAPQAIEIAQNGLANGVAGSRRWAGSAHR
jgi:hypothetical protein